MGMLQLQWRFQCVFDASISGHDNEIQRRPYRRRCTLRYGCATACSTVSFPIRRSPTHASLTLFSTSLSDPRSSASSSSSKTYASHSLWDFESEE